MVHFYSQGGGIGYENNLKLTATNGVQLGVNTGYNCDFGVSSTEVLLVNSDTIYNKTPTPGIINTNMENPDYNLFLGDGTTPPTADDYKLSGNLIGGLTQQNKGIFACGNDRLEIGGQVVNTNSTAVTVTEVAFGIYLSYSNSLQNGTYLITRDVISPVTIQPNGVKIFTVTIDYSALWDNLTTGVNAQ